MFRPLPDAAPRANNDTAALPAIPQGAPEAATALLPPVAAPTAFRPLPDAAPRANNDTAALPAIPRRAPEAATALLPPVAAPTAFRPLPDAAPRANNDTAALPPILQEGSGPDFEPAPEAEAEVPPALLHPIGAPMPSPSPEDLVLFADDHPAPPPDDSEEYIEPGLDGPSRHRRRSRRMTGPVVAAVAVCAAVLGAVLIGSLASSDDNRDQTLPDDSQLRPTAVLPTGDGTFDTGAPDPSSSASHPSGTASTDASTSPSPSPSQGEKKKEDASASATPQATAPVLSLGQSGSEVTELQLRLRQAGFYKPKADGVYDTDVQNSVSRFQRSNNISGDPDGTYGPNTRRALESQTSEP